MNLLNESDNSLYLRRETLTRALLSNTTKRTGDQSVISSQTEELRAINTELTRRNKPAEHPLLEESFRLWLRGKERYEHQQILQNYRATMASEGTPTGAAYPGSTVGFFVPMSFWTDVVSAAKSVGPFWDDGFCTLHITPNGHPLPIPSDDDVTTSAALTAENGMFSNQTLTITSNVLGTYKYLSSILVSNEQVNDINTGGIDLDAYLAKRFGVRCMRGLLQPLTNGANSGSNPIGVLTGLTASLTATGAASNDGTSGANTIGSDDVAKLIGYLDPVYYPTAKFMCHSSTMQALRLVKDKEGHPVFWGLWNDTPTIAGHPVVANNAMDQLQSTASSPTVTKTPLAFGDFSRFHVRLVHPILNKHTERYADYQQTVFSLAYRVDSVLIDPTAGSVPPVCTLQTTY